MVKTVIFICLGIGAGLLILYGVSRLMDFIADTEMLLIDFHDRIQKLEKKQIEFEITQTDVNPEE